MAWKTKVNKKSKTKYYSIINKLKKENKINEEFQAIVSNLTLEDLIALKLELSTRPVKNRLYGLPIWNNLVRITQEAVLKYAISATRTQGEAMRFLGLKPGNFHRLMKKYQITSFFLEENDKEEILN
tara:strand:+ start:618 stop:998 length:381 start_codon:yes stop_codon:yes gene_type:complete